MINLSRLELLLPPLPLTFVVAGLIWGLNRIFPWGFNFTGQVLIATFLLILGTCFIFPAVISFLKAKTTVDPRTPNKSEKLVISGLYNISRNPMYVGMILWLLALSCAQGNILSVTLSFAFGAYLSHFQIQPEERFLNKKFGDQYETYCQKVRRWI